MPAVQEPEIDALYAAPLGEFVDARKALATRAKKEGDKEAAARIAALPKPSVAAWAVNQLYRTAERKLDALLEAGASLRAAHRKGASGVREVFTAQQEQRAAIEALLRLARTLLTDAGLAASDVTLDRIGETLTFISTLNRWGDAAPGRLAKELAPPGFDALLEVLGDGEELPPVKKKEPPKEPAPGPAKASAEARRKAEQAVASAKKNEADAKGRAKEAQLAAQEAQKSANDAEAHARHLADAVKAAEAALARAKREASEAAKQASAAADQAEEAGTSADRAKRAHDAALAELRRAEAALGKGR